MIARTIIAGALLISTLVAGENEDQQKLEQQMGVEYKRAKIVELPDVWKTDIAKWIEVDALTPQLTKLAQQVLTNKGISDFKQGDEVLYDVGESHYVIMFLSSKSAGGISKYYCLGYKKLEGIYQDPEEVWIKYVQRIVRSKDVALTNDEEQKVIPVKKEIKETIWVKGKPGFAVNPYTNNDVDVRGLPPGAKVRDPHDNNPNHIFRVPASLENE